MAAEDRLLALFCPCHGHLLMELRIVDLLVMMLVARYLPRFDISC